jgi:eukaryotic-like serine/threonine-protein kinase
MPARLGRYEVRAKIGEGGMATVYLGHATGPEGDRVVALKVIKDEFSLNADFVNMFLDESKIVSRLNHPNVVRVYELGNEGARLFIAMELLFGQSLWHVWNACRLAGVRLRYDVAAYIGARGAMGLHHAHELPRPDGGPSNLVHRDVNASNIFVTYDGEVKIIDFGLAKAIGRVSKTAAGVVKGKLAYMSPEQAVGKPLDRRSDVFALATSLWEVTTDQRLFKGTDDVETLKRVYAAQVPDPTALVEGYPPALWAILRRALAKIPAERYPTAADFARDLDAFVAQTAPDMGPAMVSEVMQVLFRGERERQATWMAEASAHGDAPREPLVSPQAPRFGVGTLPQPAASSLDPMVSQLFSGPAITLRDPEMAARQQATAQGGITTGELDRIKRTAEAPFGATTGETSKVPPRTSARPSLEPAGVPRAGVGVAAFFGVLTLLFVLAAIGVGVWFLRR